MCYSGNKPSSKHKTDNGSSDHTKHSSQSESSSPAPTPAQSGIGAETRQHVGSYNIQVVLCMYNLWSFYVGAVFGWWK